MSNIGDKLQIYPELFDHVDLPLVHSLGKIVSICVGFSKYFPGTAGTTFI